MTRLLTALILFTLFTFSLSAQAGAGALTVKTEPRDAAIYLDGVLKAEGSPAVLRTRPGRHTLEVRKQGFKTAREEVFVGDDAVVVKTLRLAVDVPVVVPVAQTDKPGYYLFPERDAFETEAEFAARKKKLLAAFNARSAKGDPAFAAGQATLLKEKYDIGTGRFPVALALSDWAKRLLLVAGPYLQLDRDAARALYRAGPAFPLYLRLAADGVEVEARIGGSGREARVLGVGNAVEAERKAKQATAEARRYGFQVRADATVTDTNTGLMWKRCAEGQSGFDCTGSAAGYQWDDAMARFRSGVSFAGYNDWRLPTIEELRTLVWCSNGTPQEEAWDEKCDGKYDRNGSYQRPTIVGSAFPNTPSSGFWSASPLASDTDGAWGVVFYGGDGNWDDRSVARHVRLVRAGQ